MELVARITPKRDTHNSQPAEIEFEIVSGDDGQVSIILSDRTIVIHAKDIKDIAAIL